jgi:transcriptional regulator with XRE-family HTH domain
MAAASSPSRVGSLIRDWRVRRRRTQLELALDAGISTRHLSFVETGRSRPSPETVLLLADKLEVPVRERNHLLLAAGYAPAIPQRSLQEPEMAPVREALDLIIAGHEPYPALVVDRDWNMVAVNPAMARLAAGVDEELLEAPINAIRVGLHPRGLSQWIDNLAEVRAYFLGRLERQVALTADDALVALLEEARGYLGPAGDPAPQYREDAAANIVSPLIRMRLPSGEALSLFATVATFGTAVEVTTSELSIELAFPADLATAEALRALPRT